MLASVLSAPCAIPFETGNWRGLVPRPAGIQVTGKPPEMLVGSAGIFTVPVLCL